MLFKFIAAFLSVFIRFIQCDVTAVDETNLKSPIMNVAFISISVTKYSFGSVKAPSASQCCPIYENEGLNCNQQCTVEFKIFCSGVEAGSLGTAKLIHGTYSNSMRAHLNESKCLENDENKISIVNNEGVELLKYELAKISANQHLEKQTLFSGGSSIEYSFGKMCHPYMGNECKSLCISYGSGFHCDFTTGIRTCRGFYTGVKCENIEDPCNNKPCSNGGTCKLDQFGSPVCTCTKGTYGKYCENKVCTLENCVFGYCNADGTCSCNTGFTGKNCSEHECTKTSCSNSGVCTIDEKSVVCSCPEKSAYGDTCQNKCPTTCLGDSVCTEIMEKAKCFCPFGITGNECITEKATSPCSTLDCKNGGKCMQFSQTEAFCDCPSAYTGKLCEQPICTISNCIRGSCMDGGYCSCIESYTGIKCDRPICLAGKSCLNGGVCISSINGISCNCERNFAGPKCQYECLEKCSEFGRCEVVEGQAVCVCDQFHTGSSCDISIEQRDCDKLNCKNGAQCRFIANKYECVCSNQWSGKDCSVSGCNDNNCQRGVCVDGIGCVCTNTYLGQNCSIASCTGNYCNNQGICNIYGNTHTCQCLRSFYGNRCQYACNPRCVHGQCYNDHGVSKCRCDAKFYGKTCEYENIVDFINTILLAVLIIVAAISILTFIIALLINLVFKREKREKLFVKGTIQQGFEMSKTNDPKLNWGSLA